MCTDRRVRDGCLGRLASCTDRRADDDLIVPCDVSHDALMAADTIDYCAGEDIIDVGRAIRATGDGVPASG